MPEGTTSSTPVSTPAAGTGAKTQRETRGVLNQAQAQALVKAEQVTLAAQKLAYAAALAARDVSADFVSQLASDIGTARNKTADAIQSSTSKQSSTVDESQSARDLLNALQEVQSAAKQKYGRTSPVQLQDYFVGKRLNASRSALEQYSSAIVEKLAGDTLPGITAAKVIALGTLRQAWIDANSAQAGGQSAATTQRKELDALVQSITDRRVTIQYAANAQWPHTSDANAGIRREFSLPLNQPFNG